VNAAWWDDEPEKIVNYIDDSVIKAEEAAAQKVMDDMDAAYKSKNGEYDNGYSTRYDPPGGWAGWTYVPDCYEIGFPCRYKGNEKDPHKVFIWVHGAGQTGLLPASITDGLSDDVLVVMPIQP
jgi:hypothetical protein